MSRALGEDYGSHFRLIFSLHRSSAALAWRATSQRCDDANPHDCLPAESASRACCLQYAVIVTNQSFAGHLGANELAAAAIAVTVRP